MRKNIKFEYENDVGEGSGSVCYVLGSVVFLMVLAVLLKKFLCS